MLRRIFFLILFLLIFNTLSFAKERNNLDITSLDIRFNKTDATFVVNYNLGDFPRFYVLLLGSRGLEPKINAVFSNFSYDIIGLNDYKATLRVKNLSRFDRGYYLYDSNKKFGQGIPEMNIYLPGSSEPKKFNNIYLFDWYNVPGSDNYNLENFLKDDIGVNWKDLKIYKGIDNNSIIGIEGDNIKKKVFDITLNKNQRTCTLNANGENYVLQVINENGKLYIYSPYVYSIPNLFYKT